MNAARARRPWLWLYVVSNLVAGYIMFDTGDLVGDVVGRPVHSMAALAVALGLVVASYCLLMGPVFRFMDRLRVRPLPPSIDEDATGRKIGTVLMLLQSAFFLFNLSYGVNTAGAETTAPGSTPFALFWVFVPVDALVVIYYGYYRDNRLFYPNLMLWVVSNLARGWSGIFFFILFFEWCRAARAGKIRIGWVLGVGALVVLMYPLLINLKWIIRAGGQGNIGLAEVSEGFSVLFASRDYYSLIGDGLMQIVSRFQTTSNVVEVIRLSDFLQDEFAAGRFTPFWLEGLHGVIYEHLIQGRRSMPIGVAFTGYTAIPERVFELGSWNTNIGYPGWLFIAPVYVPLYLVYTLLLGYLSFFLSKKIGTSGQARDMVWLAWLVYLLPPWHAAFVGFLYAMCIFIVFKLLLSGRRRPQLSLNPGET